MLSAVVAESAVVHDGATADELAAFNADPYLEGPYLDGPTLDDRKRLY